MDWKINDVVEKIKREFKIVGRGDELRAILLAKKSDRPVLIEGPVGVGKTTLAKAVAQFFRQDFIRIDGDERFDEYKLVGYFEPKLVLKHGWNWKSFVPGPLVKAMMKGGVLFINEINRLSEGAQNVLIPALDEKIIEIPKLGIIEAKAGFWVIATLNPTEYIGVTPLGEALKDRFMWIKLDYQSFEEEVEIVKVHSSADEQVARFAVNVTRATRRHPDIKRGSSVRGAIDLAKLIILSMNDDRMTVETLIKLSILALGTRIELMDGTNKTVEEVIKEIVESTEPEENFFRSESKRAPKLSIDMKYDAIPERIPSSITNNDYLNNDDLSINPKIDPYEKPDVSELENEILSNKAILLFYPKHDKILTFFRGMLGYYGSRLISEIREGKDIRDILSQLWAPLDFESIYVLGKEAVKYRNLAALTALAEINPFAIAQVIEEYIFDVKNCDSIHLVHLFYLTRNQLSARKKRIFSRIANKIIVRKAMNILGNQATKRGSFKKKTKYRPGLDFDLESTLERSLDKILVDTVTDNDIICLEKYDRRTAGVIIMDISGSMYGEKNVLASIISAMAIYAMSPRDELGIILFADKPLLIKGIKERKPLEKILNDIFDIRPIGFTNISTALKKALKELRKASLRARKWVILITDGEYNRGGNPIKWARKFDRLHVIQLGGSTRGTQICRMLAYSRGKYVKVRDLDDLFTSLRKILKYPDK